jgi:hypothetical protein
VSIDERLESALRRQGDSISPEVESALGEVHRGGRRARRKDTLVRTTTLAAAAAAMAGFVWLGATGPQGPRPGDRAAPPTQTFTTVTGGPLRGSLDGVVTTPQGLAGSWALRLEGNGSMRVAPPPGYRGVVEGSVFSADAVSFRTTLFEADRCADQGTGIYTWLAVGSRIEFRVVSDRCAERAEFLESATWTMSTAPRGRG